MRRFASIVVLAVSFVACVIPPGPATLPASGATGQPHASVTAPRVKGDNPFKDAYWVLDANSTARRTADQWRTSRPEDAAAMDKIAGQPSAAWMGNWFPQIETAVKTYVWSRNRGGGLPVMILYNLPFRDCGGESARGAGPPPRHRKRVDKRAGRGGARPPGMGL